MIYQNDNLKIVMEIILSYSVRRACRSVPLGFSDSSQLPPWSTGIGVSVYVMHLPWIAAYNFRAAICAATRSSSACECISSAIFSAFPREDEEKRRLSERFIRRDCAEFSTSHLEKLHLESDTMGGYPFQASSFARLSLIEIQDAPFTWNVCRDSVLNHVVISSEKFHVEKLHPRACLLPLLYVISNYSEITL